MYETWATYAFVGNVFARPTASKDVQIKTNLVDTRVNSLMHSSALCVYKEGAHVGTWNERIAANRFAAISLGKYFFLFEFFE